MTSTTCNGSLFPNVARRLRCVNTSLTGTKAFGIPSKGQGGDRNVPAQYLKNNKCYKHETLGDVRGVRQRLEKYQADITAFAL